MACPFTYMSMCLLHNKLCIQGMCGHMSNIHISNSKNSMSMSCPLTDRIIIRPFPIYLQCEFYVYICTHVDKTFGTQIACIGHAHSHFQHLYQYVKGITFRYQAKDRTCTINLNSTCLLTCLGAFTMFMK